MRRAARRRRPHLLLACAVGGLAVAPADPVVAVALAAAVATFAAWALGGRAALTAGGLVIVAASIGVARMAAIDHPAGAAPPGSLISAEATVIERPRPGLFGSTAPLEIESGPAAGLRVHAALPADVDGLDAGVRVSMRGLVRDASARGAAGGVDVSPDSGRGETPSEANAGAPGTPGFGPLPAADTDRFDFAAFLRSRRIGREVRILSARVIGRRAGIQGAVDSIRRRTERGISAGLPRDRAALARGMVLGQDGDVPEPVREDFRRSGLAHLLAASGQNVALLCALVLPVLMLARAGPRTRVAVLIPLIALYVALAGAGASIARAGAMAAALLIALALGRPGSALYALLLAAAATLALNPRATGDPGWQLSFAAVAGMLALGPLLARPLKPLPRPLAEAIGATVAATIATAPLLAHQFGAVSLVALPANLFAFVAVAPVMWIGMSQAAIAQLAALGTPVAAVAHAVTSTLSIASELALAWIEAIAGVAADRSWAQVEERISATATVAAYAVLGCGVAAARWIAIRGAAFRAAAIGDLHLRWLELPRRLRVRMTAAAAASALIALLSAARPAGPPNAFTVYFIDVGQGDATLVRDPTGAAILFDGGPPEARVDRKLRRLGVRRLDVVVATHQSRDHQGGLAEVVRRFPVGLFLDGGGDTSDRTFAALRRLVDSRGIARRAARAGERINAGATEIRILWPPRGSAGRGDPNLHATVALVRHRAFDVFLSADAESPALSSLPLRPVEAMKVPHHGSEDPGLPALLRRLRPHVAAIGVGRGNRYGHPRRSTLDALRRVPRVYRTDRDGAIELIASGSEIEVRTHR